MKTNKVIWLDRYQAPFFWGYCPSRKAWDVLARDFKIDMGWPLDDGDEFMAANVTHFRRPADRKMCCVVTVSPDLMQGRVTRIEFHGVLVHEVMHVYQSMLESMREKNPSIEFEAYTVQSMYMELAWVIEQCHSVRYKRVTRGAGDLVKV